MACRRSQLLRWALGLSCSATLLALLAYHHGSTLHEKAARQEIFKVRNSPSNSKTHYKRSFKVSFEPGTTNRRMPDRFWEDSRPIQKRGNEFHIKQLPRAPYCRKGNWMLIIVKSAVHHFDRRMVFRRFFNADKGRAEMARLIFILGKDSSVDSDRLKRETEQYDDVAIGNFEDTYTNLTLKSLFALKLVNQFCRDVRFVMSVDDDAYMNLSDITMYLSSSEQTTGVLQCGDRLNMVAKVKRNGKWSIQKEKYDKTYFPPYCNGACYVMSGDVASKLHEMSLKTQWDITIDDALITGILREKIRVNLARMPKGICTHHSERSSAISS